MRTYGIRPDYRHETFLKDEFGTNTNGTPTGELGWINGAGSQSIPAPTAGHPGQTTLSTGAASGTTAVFSLATNGVGIMLGNELFDMLFIAQISDTSSNSQYRMGLAGSVGSDPPSNGIYFERLTGDTSWFGVGRFGAVQTRSSAVIAQDVNTWHTFRIRQNVAGTVLFSVDFGTEQSVATNVPNSTMNPFFQVRNSTGSAFTITVDYWELRILGLNRT